RKGVLIPTTILPIVQIGRVLIIRQTAAILQAAGAVMTDQAAAALHSDIHNRRIEVQTAKVTTAAGQVLQPTIVHQAAVLQAVEAVMTDQAAALHPDIHNRRIEVQAAKATTAGQVHQAAVLQALIQSAVHQAVEAAVMTDQAVAVLHPDIHNRLPEAQAVKATTVGQAHQAAVIQAAAHTAAHTAAAEVPAAVHTVAEAAVVAPVVAAEDDKGFENMHC
ncbi:MAG: hypothetical protein FWF54_01120, partial [Candidatus Azobacteroides sp.]|nr:hypothetical protein [Candidatus Azobacteroides sp.]